MKITVNINGKATEIELTADQVQVVKKASEKITDRIKTFDDVLVELGISKNIWKQVKDSYEYEDELAYKQVKLIAQALNEGWTAEPYNEEQYKYYPYFRIENNAFVYDDYGHWYSNAIVGSRLCFASKDLAIYAATQFSDLYNEFLQ